MVNCHCRDCQWASGGPEYVGIRTGSLDDPSWFKAVADIWVESAQPWAIMSESTAKFQRGPPVPKEDWYGRD